MRIKQESLVSIGLAEKFVRFPQKSLQKPERTFWPTQYIHMLAITSNTTLSLCQPQGYSASSEQHFFPTFVYTHPSFEKPFSFCQNLRPKMQSLLTPSLIIPGRMMAPFSEAPSMPLVLHPSTQHMCACLHGGCGYRAGIPWSLSYLGSGTGLYIYLQG